MSISNQKNRDHNRRLTWINQVLLKKKKNLFKIFLLHNIVGTQFDRNDKTFKSPLASGNVYILSKGTSQLMYAVIRTYIVIF